MKIETNSLIEIIALGIFIKQASRVAFFKLQVLDFKNAKKDSHQLDLDCSITNNAYDVRKL